MHSRFSDRRGLWKYVRRVNMECRLVPIFPVRDVGGALALYRRLGFDVEGYEVDGRLIYGFVSRDSVSFHVNLTTNL